VAKEEAKCSDDEPGRTEDGTVVNLLEKMKVPTHLEQGVCVVRVCRDRGEKEKERRSVSFAP
jgi:hypothetical protein